MPANPGRAIVFSMTEPDHRTLRVELNLVPDADPIRGHARDADGVEHGFAGWLELIQMLDRARISQQPSASGIPTATERKSP
jgi:hypothetical protein